MIINNFFIPFKLFSENDDFIFISKGGNVPLSFDKVALSSESPKISEINFHKNVKLIHILDGYPHEIKKEMFPKTIVGLIIYNINYVLTSESIPDTLLIICFNGYKNQITKEIVKKSIKLLGVSGEMGFPLNKNLLEVGTIKTLYFDGNYSHPITNESIIDNLYNLYIVKTKYPLDEQSFKTSTLYPPVFPFTVFFNEGYKFPIIGNVFPKFNNPYINLNFDIKIGNISNPVTKELFKDLPLCYRVHIGWGYKHKLTAGIIGNYERYMAIGDIVHNVPEVFFGLNAKFFGGYSHKITPTLYALLMHELVFDEVKYPITKDLMPSMGVLHLKFERGYDHKLTPDLFEETKALTLDGCKSHVFTKDSLPKLKCRMIEINLKNLQIPFDLTYFPTDMVKSMSLYNISQVIGINQLPKSLMSLTLTNVKLDSNLIGIIPASVSVLTIDDIDQQLTKDSIPRNLKVMTILNYKFPISKDLFPDSVHSITLNETINPFTIEMVPQSLKMLICHPDYNFFPLEKSLDKYSRFEKRG
ncbi:hypothetical protein RB653_000568 [Dictyostelium firmibasis]|uniref:FNIP repeat-containing protein n=1 Tax=Dictyostelium firmibasis TaxID=79012 RepID=A0AAN7UFI4_9MYCE